MLNQNTEKSVKYETVDRRMIYAAFLLLIVVGALITYKTSASLAVLEKTHSTGVFKSRFDLIQSSGGGAGVSVLMSALDKTVSYFSVVWIALLFGVLISGAVRVFVSPQWLTKLFHGGRFRTQVTAAAAGAPLMLCSCCVAPIFSSIYERSSRLAPSLALMLAAPSLNPAAVILTFMLFGGKIGVIRLLSSAFVVLVTGLLAEHFVKLNPLSCSIDEASASLNDSSDKNSITIAFITSCLKVALQTLPLIIIGVAISMLLAQWLPVNTLASASIPATIAIIMLVALVSVLLAMPTFFEIPLALMMTAAGLPIGAAVAVLIAGPAINLPSLLTIGRSTGWKVPLLVAASVWALAITGGLLANLL